MGLLLGCAVSALWPAAPRAATCDTWHFTDVTARAGITAAHVLASRVSAAREIVAGAACGDYDGDGWTDLYFVGGDASRNFLYRNNGDGTFTDRALEAGVALPGTVGNGATFADWDGDGDLDLFVGGIESTDPVLFRNEGDGTFRDVTAASGVVMTQDTFSATFGDYDGDGDLDLFAAHWFAIPRGTGHVWRNEGDGTFRDADLIAGYVGFRPYPPTDAGDNTFGYRLADLDGDGDRDLVAASDFGTSHCFRNDSGTFTDRTDPSVIIDDNGMGSCVGDCDNDGDLDWFVSSIYAPDLPPFKVGNRLYLNDGAGVLSDGTAAAGVADGSWGWGSSFQDFDNDGWLDIYHVNGWRPAYPYNESRLFVNDGDATFTERAAELGCADRGEGRGVCCFDYDRDGDIDIFIANNDQPAVLYRNDGPHGHWLTVKLAGEFPNTQELGARIRVTAGGLTQLREVNNGSNFLSQDPADAHFGLGAAAAADVVEVTWTDGTVTVLADVEADRVLTIDRTTGSVSQLPGRPAGDVALLGAAPNPFRESTAIRFDLAAGAGATLRVFDARGRLVRSLREESCAAGTRSVIWDGRDQAGSPVAAGVYWYRVRAGADVVTGRVARVR